MPKNAAPHDRVELRRLRVNAGLNQTELAGLSGLSTQLISALECGDSGASPKSLRKIARVLGCQVADLLAPETQP